MQTVQTRSRRNRIVTQALVRSLKACQSAQNCLCWYPARHHVAKTLMGVVGIVWCQKLHWLLYLQYCARLTSSLQCFVEWTWRATLLASFPAPQIVVILCACMSPVMHTLSSATTLWKQTAAWKPSRSPQPILSSEYRTSRWHSKTDCCSASGAQPKVSAGVINHMDGTNWGCLALLRNGL